MICVLAPDGVALVEKAPYLLEEAGGVVTTAVIAHGEPSDP
jgi:hypothetical protein